MLEDPRPTDVAERASLSNLHLPPPHSHLRVCVWWGLQAHFELNSSRLYPHISSLLCTPPRSGTCGEVSKGVPISREMQTLALAVLVAALLGSTVEGFRALGGSSRRGRCQGPPQDVGRAVLRRDVGQPTLLSMSGYIAPERDPEYRSMVKKSMLQPSVDFESSSMLPLPREGDVVQYGGKWPGELSLGRIRFIRYSNSTEAWIADIVPLKEGKSANVFTVDRTARTFFDDVDKLAPVRSFFMRSENGYKVSFRKNSTEVILKAASYRALDSGFVPPSKPVSLAAVQEDMVSYEALKARMISSTLKFAAVGAVGTQLAFGSDVSLPYALGGGAGALYLFLLGKMTDGIGAGYSAAASGNLAAGGNSKLDNFLGKSRFAVPLLLVLLLGIKGAVIDHRAVEPFSILSRESFLGAVGGFLTYRVALYGTELAGEMRTEDWLSVVPGSMAEGYRLSKSMKAKEEAGGASGASVALSPVVFVTGPKAAGRSSLALRLKLPGENKEIRFVKFLTTDTVSWRKNPERYQLVGSNELDELRGQGGLIYEGVEKSPFGEATNIALSLRDFAPPTKDAPGKVAYLIDGQPDILDSLSKVPSFQLLSVWISLQSKEQFIEKATQIVQKEALLELKDGSTPRNALAQKSAQIVSDLVNEAARDITFYMSKAPLFEYTLLNSE